ncbi:unnamed protein product, partial [Brenthis ino]
MYEFVIKFKCSQAPGVAGRHMFSRTFTRSLSSLQLAFLHPSELSSAHREFSCYHCLKSVVIRRVAPAPPPSAAEFILIILAILVS